MRKSILAFLPVFLLASCGVSSVTTTEESKTSTKETTEFTTTASPIDKDEGTVNILSADFSIPEISSKDDITYSDLFNLGNKISIEITMDSSEMEKLEADYETGFKSEIYRHCKSVTITMVNYDNTFTWVYQDVGIRQKGNTSRSTVYKDGSLCGLNHFKLSFDETFDDKEAYGSDAYDWTGKDAEYEERSNRDFLGLSGLDLKWNKNLDSTHIKEIYASKMYQASGILSQYTGLSEFGISIGSKKYDMGLYTIYEPATKSMIKRHAKDSEILNFDSWSDEKKGTYGVSGSSYGDLYKCSYGVGEGATGTGADLSVNSMKDKRIGAGNLTGSYIPAYELKSNIGQSDSSTLRALGTAITSGSYSKIAGLMDMQYFALTEAANWIIGNPDDLRNNNNNYMIYFRKTDGKAIFIPIDNDRCFGITKDWNPDGNAMMGRGVFERERACGGTSNNLYTKTILNSTTKAREYYLTYLRMFKASDWAKEDTFNSLYAIAANTYKNSWESDFQAVGFSLDDTVNVPFAYYMKEKLALIPSSDSSESDTPVTTTAEISGSGDYDEGNYGDVYLVGSHNGWGGTTCPMTYKGYGEYTITFTPGISGTLEFKFNNGSDWSSINWGTKDNGATLSLDSGSNFKIKNLSLNSELTVTINTVTLSYSYSVQ